MAKEILVLDIETTGFQYQKSDKIINGKRYVSPGGCIVEIGIVKLNLETGHINAIFDSLCREKRLNALHLQEPYGWIFENSDLTPEELRKAPMLDDIAIEVQTIINDFPLGITAFNKKFDFPYLESRGFTFPNILECPMMLSKDIVKAKFKNDKKGTGANKFPSVEEAYKFFFPESTYIEQHRGADDAVHEAEIVYELYKRGVFKV